MAFAAAAAPDAPSGTCIAKQGTFNGCQRTKNHRRVEVAHMSDAE